MPFSPVSVVLNALEALGQTFADGVGPLIAEEETAAAPPEPDKLVAVVLPETHTCYRLVLFFDSEPLRRRAPPVRLKREDEHVRVFEVLILFRHSDVEEPSEHIAVCRCRDDGDIRLVLDLVEQSLGSERTDVAVVDDARRRSPGRPFDQNKTTW